MCYTEATQAVIASSPVSYWPSQRKVSTRLAVLSAGDIKLKERLTKCL